jgi:hypothetical protein
LEISDKKYKLQIVDGDDIEFNLISAQSADNIFAAILKYDDQPEYIEFLFNKLTNNKHNIETLHAGIPSLVIYTCLIKSGVIKDPESLIEIIESGRKAIGDNVYFSIFSNIISTLPNYKLDELKTKTVNELFELFVFAEKVANRELFDTDKMRQSLETPRSGKVVKKGIASVTPEEIDMLKHMLAREEKQFDGMPRY